MIDYSKYTREELIECLLNVDKERYPDNYNQIVKQISLIDQNITMQQPQPNSTPSSDEEIINAAFDKLNKNSTSWITKGILGILGAVLSIAVITSKSDAIYALAIIPVLLIHELGHLLAMKFFGYKNTGIFFIPFFGALTIGIPTNPSKKNDAIVSLAGPMTGIVSGLCIGLLFHYFHSKWLVYLTIYSFTLNLFNLLPVLPLDGGQFWDAIVTSRNYIASIVFKLICSAILLLLSIKLKTPIFALIGAALLARLYVEKIDRKVAADLQLSKTSIMNSDRETEFRRIILSYNRLIKNRNENKRIQMIANRSQMLYSNTLSDHPSWLFSAVTGGGYFLVVLMTILLTSVSYAIKRKYGM